MSRNAKILAQGLQHYNSPADWTTKLFEPSTDSASLLVEIEKKFFLFWVCGSLGGGRHKWEWHFHFFGLVYADLDANPMSQFFRSSFFFKTGLSSESLQPLIGFLVYLDPKLCHQKVVKISTPTKGNLGWIMPSLDMAITCLQNRLECCSSPQKTREDL